MNALNDDFTAATNPLTEFRSLWLANALALDESAKKIGFRAGQDRNGNLCVKRGNKIVGGIVSSNNVQIAHQQPD